MGNAILGPRGWIVPNQIGASLEIDDKDPSILSYLARSGAVIPHRGCGGLYAPDNAVQSFEAAVNARLPCIDVDVHKTTTGLLICMHDATVDRTTTATGNTVDVTEATLASIIVSPAHIGLSSGWVRERAPTWQEVVAKFGHRTMICVEDKTTNAFNGIIAELRAAGVSPARVCIQSFDVNVAQSIAERGWIAALNVADAAATNFADIAARGISVVIALFSTWTRNLVAAARAAGLVTGAYTINRRVERDAWVQMGGQCLASDEPLYLMPNPTPLTRDEYGSGRWSLGMIAHNAGRGALVPARNSWSIDRTPGGYGGVLQGQFSPLPKSFVFDFKLYLSAVNDSSRWGAVTFCTQTDVGYGDAGPYVDGYHALFRQSGAMELHRQTSGGTPVQIGSGTGAAMVVGVADQMRITVNDSNIVVQNLTRGTTMNSVDSSRRGGGVHFGASGALVEFSDVWVRPQ